MNGSYKRFARNPRLDRRVQEDIHEDTSAACRLGGI